MRAPRWLAVWRADLAAGRMSEEALREDLRAALDLVERMGEAAQKTADELGGASSHLGTVLGLYERGPR